MPSLRKPRRLGARTSCPLFAQGSSQKVRSHSRLHPFIPINDDGRLAVYSSICERENF